METILVFVFVLVVLVVFGLILVISGWVFFWMESIFNNTFKAWLASILLMESILGLVYVYLNY